MGLYNRLSFEDQEAEAIQFRYGFCWSTEYRIGDEIDWGEYSRPSSARGRVFLRGLGERSTQQDMHYYSILIEDNVIVSVRRISKSDYDYLEQNEGCAQSLTK